MHGAGRTLANPGPAKLGRTKQLCSSIQSAGSLVLLWELVPLGPLLGQLPGPGLAWLGLSQWPSLHLWNWLLPQALAWWLLQALAWQLWPGSFCSWLWPGSFCSWPWPGSWWLWPDWLWPDRLWPLGTGHQLRLWSGHQWSQSPSPWRSWTWDWIPSPYWAIDYWLALCGGNSKLLPMAHTGRHMASGPHGQRHLPARSLAIPILDPWLALEFWFDTLLWSGLQVFGAPLATAVASSGALEGLKN